LIKEMWCFRVWTLAQGWWYSSSEGSWAVYRDILRTLYIGWRVPAILWTRMTTWFSSDSSWDLHKVSLIVFCQSCDSVAGSTELLPGMWRSTEEHAIYKGTVFLHRQFCDSRSANAKCNSSCRSAFGETAHSSGRRASESIGSSDEADQG
jgi:hypothetical protein